MGLAALAGGLHRLPRQIGLKRAMGMILTGPACFGAGEGFRTRLRQRGVPPGEALALPSVGQTKSAENSPMSIRASKQAVMDGMNVPLPDAMDRAARISAVREMVASADDVEGPKAFAGSVRRAGKESRSVATLLVLSGREQPPAGLDNHLRASNDVGVGGVLAPVMADAIDRGYKQHAGGHDRGEYLGIVASAAWHPNGFAVRESRRGFFDLVKHLIHHGGLAGSDALDLDAASARCAGVSREFAQQCSRRSTTAASPSRTWNRISARAGNDAGRARIERDAACGPRWSLRFVWAAGKRPSIAASHNRAAARPASFRSFIRVVPA